MNNSAQTYQRLFGLRFGSLFAAIVSFVWIGLLSMYMSEPWQAKLLPALGIAIVSTVVWWAITIVTCRMPPHKKLPYMSSGKFWAIFYAIVAVEVIIIFAFIQFFNMHGLPEAMWPTIVIVVALHWIPLGMMNGIKEWWGVSAVICGLSIAALVFAKHDQTTNLLGVDANIWGLVSTAAMVVIMLLAAVVFQFLYVQTWRRAVTGKKR